MPWRRVELELPEPLIAALSKRALRVGVSVDELVAAAVARKLAGAAEEGPS